MDGYFSLNMNLRSINCINVKPKSLEIQYYKKTWMAKKVTEFVKEILIVATQKLKTRSWQKHGIMKNQNKLHRIFTICTVVL